MCGPDIPVGIRLCSEELLNDVRGNTPEESMITYQMAEEAGADYISCTLGWQESIYPVISRDIPQGNWLYLAKRAKEHVKIPVQMAYRLFTPDRPEKAIAAGELDFWEMCRSMIADPYMPKKVLEGREDEVRHCVACNLCLARLFRDAPMTCYINPLCAHEHDEKFYPQKVEEGEEKTVMIVGAGPSGMECAYVAAQRGHEVHVYDTRQELGGTLLEAAHAPLRRRRTHDLHQVPEDPVREVRSGVSPGHRGDRRAHPGRTSRHRGARHGPGLLEACGCRSRPAAGW